MEVFSPLPSDLKLPANILDSKNYFVSISQNSAYLLYLSSHSAMYFVYFLNEKNRIISLDTKSPICTYFPMKNCVFANGHISGKTVFLNSINQEENLSYMEIIRFDQLKAGYNFQVVRGGIQYFYGISYDLVMIVNNAAEVHAYFSGQPVSEYYSFEVNFSFIMKIYRNSLYTPKDLNKIYY